ncbi:MAG: alginate lyase family protein [Caldilineaceae bacterium]
MLSIYLQSSAALLLHWSMALVAALAGLSPAAPATPTSPTAEHQIYLPLVTQPGVVASKGGIWLTQAEIAALPVSGAAWENLKARADESAGAPDLSDQSNDTNVHILAKALVYARTGEARYQQEVIAALRVVTYNHTEEGGRTLALGRELAAYVIAADIIDLAHSDAKLDHDFRDKLRELLTKPLEGWNSVPRTLQDTHELRPNNWGTHAGASRLAIALYLGDTAEVERSALVFRGYVGDFAAYHGFNYDDDLSWQANPAQPVGINPVGTAKSGQSIDGALPEEMRRGGSFQWPPLETNYPWEALQGAVVQAALLDRAGYPAWEWQDQALLRAVQFLYNIGWPAQGDDEWIPPLINCVYGASFPVAAKVHPGKNMGWTDWAHEKCR